MEVSRDIDDGDGTVDDHNKQDIDDLRVLGTRLRGDDKRRTERVQRRRQGRASNITIITPAMYRQSMGKVAAAKSYLRA